MPKVEWKSGFPDPEPIRTYYIGIDPGASGGMASIESGNSLILSTSMPSTEKDTWIWIHSHVLPTPCEERVKVFATIEKVSGYIGEAHPGSAMFKFGMSYGGLRMALAAAGIPFDEVTPQRWQKALGISPRKKDEPKGHWKNRLKQKAQQLFPSEHVTLATADALLIAEYCRRKQEGKL